MTSSSSEPRSSPTTETSRGPEQLVRDLAGGWTHRGDELDHLLDRVCSSLAQEANHELRQILTLLSTELELAQLRSDGDEVTLDRETLDKILDALHRGTQIVGRYLARNEVAKLMIHLDREPIDTASFARSLLQREEIDPEAPTIETEIGATSLRADGEKLHSALGYLIGRFWHAREPGGRFRFELKGETGHIDGYIGIDPSPASAGDLVQELDASLDIDTIGLDIPYVRAVLERHGGSLYVDRRRDTLGYGFTIPREETDEEVGT